MFDILLYQPEIPPNTGNIIRLCANSGARLHLIEPLGFQLDTKSCRRAGLDYAELAEVSVWPDLQACLAHCRPKTLWVITKFGQQRYDKARFRPQDALLFGSETAGLPADLRASLPADTQLFLPMQAGNRSLNLSNAVAAVLYEGWRQNDFASS